MSDIQYKVAKTVREAASLMAAAKGKGYILAGGTDLLVQMKSGARTPGVIVDVKKIPEMVSISEKNGAFTIGAATPAAVLGEHKKLRKAWPGVIEAVNLIGSTQVQGRASAGGNLCNASPAADSVPALVAAGCSGDDHKGNAPAKYNDDPQGAQHRDGLRTAQRLRPDRAAVV